MSELELAVAFVNFLLHEVSVLHDSIEAMLGWLSIVQLDLEEELGVDELILFARVAAFVFPSPRLDRPRVQIARVNL